MLKLAPEHGGVMANKKQLLCMCLYFNRCLKVMQYVFRWPKKSNNKHTSMINTGVY